MKACIACGMPMITAEEFAMGDIHKDYCRYCARQDGTMQSYDEKLASLTEFLTKTQGLDEEATKATAQSMMANLPAWKV